MAIDNGIPLITDVKCAKLFIDAIYLLRTSPPLRPSTDFLTTQRIIRFRGLIDVHVHTRDPGGFALLSKSGVILSNI